MKRRIAWLLLTLIVLIASLIIIPASQAVRSPGNLTERRDGGNSISRDERLDRLMKGWGILRPDLQDRSSDDLRLTSLPFADHISTLVAACTGSNVTDFNLGDTVCGEIEDSGAAGIPKKFTWQHGGTIWQISPVFSATTPQHDFFAIPATMTSDLGGGHIYDIRGTWLMVKTRGTNLQSFGNTAFRVHDPAHIAADLSTGGTVSSANPVTAGNNITYLFQVFNNGPDTATNAVYKITVPTNTTFVSFTGAAGWTCPATPTLGVLTCTRASEPAAPLNVAAPAEDFTLIVTAPMGTPTNTIFTATGFISSATSDLRPQDNQNSENISVVPGGAGLALTSPTASITTEGFAPPNGAIDPGETVTVSFGVTTSGAVTNLVGTLRPTGNVTSPNGPISFGSSAGAAVLSASFTFTGDPAAQCGSILIPSIDFASDPASTSRGTLVFPLFNMSSNAGSQEVPQCAAAGASADLSITKTDGATTYTPGTTTIYTIVVSNAGPDGATGATVSDPFTANIASATWTCVGAGGGTCTASGSGNISQTVNLPSGGLVTFTVTANISGAAAGNLVNVATVVVPAGVTDPTPGNNAANDTDTPVSSCNAGDLDAGFGTGGKTTTDFTSAGNGDQANAVAIQPADQKIVAAGQSTQAIGNSNFSLARYSTAGILDTAGFGAGTGKVTTDFTGFNDGAQAVAVQADGKIVAAGYTLTDGSGTQWDFALARYNTNGTLDTAGFGAGTGKVSTTLGAVDIANGVAIQTADQKIVVAGQSGSFWALARYNTDGTLDTAGFAAPNGKLITTIPGTGHAVAIDASGKIVVAGDSNGDFAVARFNANGTLDTAGFASAAAIPGLFTTSFSVNTDSANAVAIQTSDGKIVLAGFSALGNDFALARVNTDGTLDTAGFGAGTGKVSTDFFANPDQAHAVLIQGDGKIVAVGEANDATNTNILFALARYSTAGVLDAGFGTGGKVTNAFAGTAKAFAAALQSDGKIVGGGLYHVPASSDNDFIVARFCDGGGGGGSCTLTCPANITQSNDLNQCGAVVTYPAPTPSGTCGTVNCSPASGSSFPVGATTVTCTSSTGPTCTFTVTVQDTQAPTITCPANVTQANDSNQCGAVVNYPAPTPSDNCPGVTANCSPASGSFFPVGTTTVTCTASDTSPNSPDTTCTFTVTVQDTQAPTITCPANVVTNTDPGQNTAVVNYAAPAVADNCPGVGAPTCSPASGSTFPAGVTTVNCSVADASPNSPDSSCNFTVTVRPPRYWTSAGATGTADEDSASIVSNDDFAVQLKDGVTGTATVRYNITAVKGISAFCPATQSVVNLRFRNSDNTGAHAQVKLEIHRTHILNGGNDIVYSFNSNGLGAGSAFTTVSAAPNIDFDFSTYIYWVEGTVFRDQAAQFADLGSIEIYESVGTPCP